VRTLFGEPRQGDRGVHSTGYENRNSTHNGKDTGHPRLEPSGKASVIRDL